MNTDGNTIQFYSEAQAREAMRYISVLGLDGATFKLGQRGTTSVHVTLTSASGVQRHLIVDADGRITKDKTHVPENRNRYFNQAKIEQFQLTIAECVTRG